MKSSFRWGLPPMGENLLQVLRAPALVGFVVVLGAVHVWVEAGGGVVARATCYRSLGLNRDAFAAGAWWQAFTHAFLHGGWAHLFTNMIAILLLGARISHILGPGSLLRALPLGILAGATAHLLLGGRSDGQLLVGASAPVFSLLLLLTTLSPESRMWPLPVSAKNLGIGLILSSAILALADPAARIPGMSSLGRALQQAGCGDWFRMGHACHLGGALAGWAQARWLLRRRVTLSDLQKQRSRREGAEEMGSRPPAADQPSPPSPKPRGDRPPPPLPRKPPPPPES